MAKPARKPRRITAQYLERAAIYYLERYSSSSGNLKAVLRRKVWRAARQTERETEVDEEQAAEWIDETVAKLKWAGLLDDEAYARMRVLSLRRSGESQRSIRMKLMAKSVESDLIERALAQDEPENDELTAAIAYARRRRLGPWRAEAEWEERREKDMAALARRGFSFDICRRVIEAADEAALYESQAEWASREP
ncbi:MAG: RecX family transcriptional regulator [Rhodospirillaceae bacterium]|jgi:regulatory protein|nr:RecX family transcriptional regulator [Rhodospirillaceae bacterium]MBT6205923.1 RecX family transcriptional regulator [Rhodospirillaceae bacterium]MBT6511270.1 RecX family transcriptional regulator [Rhodospirillaceae bacterium]MBT7615080.1 RecX family transcriptional regulator [Rhodospirillaceae bacterium]MBT7648566.1 RecX family transcriptional regulator [Rhodospirillaceae bacterium]